MKTKNAKEKNETILELEYSLDNLPSAQHKTGLAGLVLLLETMEEREMAPLPEYKENIDGTWTFQFTRKSFQAVFDELYDGENIIVESPSKWSGASPIEIREKEVEKNGKKKTEKVFVYEITVPKGSFFKGLFSEGPEGEKRLKLWRDALWSTYKGKPASRGVYSERVQNNPCPFVEKLWSSLIRKKGGIEDLKGSLLLGAEGFNAEGIPFKGLLHENVLLHFTPIACALFVVRNFMVKKGNRDNKGTYSVEWDENGYVFVMPEITKIKPYLEKLREWFQNNPEEETKSFRPSSSIIDLPEESGLEFLSAISGRRLETEGVFDEVEGVEYYHMTKKGNSVKLLSSSRIPVSVPILNEYNSIVSAGGRKKPLNFLYKTLRIRNLLNDTPWYVGMENILETYPSEFLIWFQKNSSQDIPFFGRDINNKFKEIAQKTYYIEQEAKEMEERDATFGSIDHTERLAAKVRNIVRNFIISELKKRPKIKIPSGKTHLERTKEDCLIIYPEDYLAELKKICTGAFLALRGRSGTDIAEFFTGTLCAIPQFLKYDFKNEEKDDYLLMAKSLVDPKEREKIKLFAMLAFSACSYVYYPKESQSQSEIETE